MSPVTAATAATGATGAPGGVAPPCVSDDDHGRRRAAALAGVESELELALAAFVLAAWEAGFSRTTAASVAAAALEEGVRKRRRRTTPVPPSAHVARWEARAARLYDGLDALRDG